MSKLTKVDMCYSLMDVSNVSVYYNHPTLFSCFFASKDSKKFAFIEQTGSRFYIRFCSVNDEYVKTALSVMNCSTAVKIIRDFFDGIDITNKFDTYSYEFSRKTKINVDVCLEKNLFSLLENIAKFSYDPYAKIFKVYACKKDKTMFILIERCTFENFRVLYCDTKRKYIGCLVYKGINGAVRGLFNQLTKYEIK